MNRLAIDDHIEEVCPYLGSEGDRRDCPLVSSLINRCYRANLAAPIKLNYQLTCCLTKGYSTCAICQGNESLPPPLEKRVLRQRPERSKRSQVSFWMILGAIVIIGLLAWQSLSGGLFRFDGWRNSLWGAKAIALTETSNVIPTIVPTLAQSTSTATLIPFTPSPTLTVATFTPTLAVFHALETPIGIVKQFIIHRVQLGESLPLLATRFGTTIGAIQQVNYCLMFPFW